MTVLPDLTISHPRLLTSKSVVWNLSICAYIHGVKVPRRPLDWNDQLKSLEVAHERIWLLIEINEHIGGLLDTGISLSSIISVINNFRRFISYVDNEEIKLKSKVDVANSIYRYSEYLIRQASLKKITSTTAYTQISSLGRHFNLILNIGFNIQTTRIKKGRKSRRAVSRDADKVNMEHASKLAKFAFDISKNFDSNCLRIGQGPILVKVRESLTKVPVNLTTTKKHTTVYETQDFRFNSARRAFNLRVAAEIFIFLGMTMANPSQVYNLKRYKFDFKPLGKNYEVREYKNRRGGEVLLKIPKPYRASFEKYLSFMDEYAHESQWLFPTLNKVGEFSKRIDNDIKQFKCLLLSNQMPWITPRKFKAIGLNILLRLSGDETIAAEFGNHTIKVFRDSYEFPSLQKAIIEVTQFWNKNDPFINGEPTVSLFGTPCSGTPKPIENASSKLPRPDCLTPSGCIGCQHYRDEDTLDYVWNLYSFRYLKIIEASSYKSKEIKPSNIVIDWCNLKINWFKKSLDKKHSEWAAEASMRIDEGDYHPIWSRKIEKYRG